MWSPSERRKSAGSTLQAELGLQQGRWQPGHFLGWLDLQGNLERKMVSPGRGGKERCRFAGPDGENPTDGFVSRN